MKIMSTLIFLLGSTVLQAQQVLPEVTLISENRKASVRESISAQIQKASSTNLRFPVNTGPGRGLPTGAPCCFYPSVVKPARAKPANIRIRCGFTTKPDKPMLVVDGVMKDYKILALIDPNDIVSIEILKSATALAIFGSPAKAGVILLRTRKEKIRYDSIRILDRADHSVVPKATLSFVLPERKDTLRYIADDSGMVISNSMGKLEGSTMIVSATGYRTMIRSFTGFRDPDGASSLLLERDIKSCPEVIIACFDCTRRIRCGYRIKVIRGVTENAPDINHNKMALYPNPVARGGQINIEYPLSAEPLLLSVTGMDGKMILSRPVTLIGGVQLQTGTWARGPYIIRLHYANGRQAASRKLVIQ